MAGRANALARRGEASPFQTDENSAIDIRHDSRCAHACAGHCAMIRAASSKCSFAARWLARRPASAPDWREPRAAPQFR